MKVTVSHLKAPWPAGVAVGNVVDLQGVDKLPAWCLGKCEQVADETEAAFVWSPPAPVEEAAALPPADGDEAQIQAALRAAAEQEVAELRRMLAAAEAALAAKGAELDKALADLAETGTKLAAAEAALSGKTPLKAGKG